MKVIDVSADLTGALTKVSLTFGDHPHLDLHSLIS